MTYTYDATRGRTLRDGVPVDDLEDVRSEADGLAYLTPELEYGYGDAVPCSRYGRNGRECAPIAWRVALIVSDAAGEWVTYGGLEHAMSLVVNDHDDVAYLLAEYGTESERDEWAEYRLSDTYGAA